MRSQDSGNIANGCSVQARAMHKASYHHGFSYSLATRQVNAIPHHNQRRAILSRWAGPVAIRICHFALQAAHCCRSGLGHRPCRSRCAALGVLSPLSRCHT
jgi:hypothetical protein